MTYTLCSCFLWRMARLNNTDTRGYILTRMILYPFWWVMATMFWTVQFNESSVKVVCYTQGLSLTTKERLCIAARLFYFVCVTDYYSHCRIVYEDPCVALCPLATSCVHTADSIEPTRSYDAGPVIASSYLVAWQVSVLSRQPQHSIRWNIRVHATCGRCGS